MQTKYIYTCMYAVFPFCIALEEPDLIPQELYTICTCSICQFNWPRTSANSICKLNWSLFTRRYRNRCANWQRCESCLLYPTCHRLRSPASIFALASSSKGSTHRSAMPSSVPSVLPTTRPAVSWWACSLIPRLVVRVQRLLDSLARSHRGSKIPTASLSSLSVSDRNGLSSNRYMEPQIETQIETHRNTHRNAWLIYSLLQRNFETKAHTCQPNTYDTEAKWPPTTYCGIKGLWSLGHRNRYIHSVDEFRLRKALYT